MKKSSRPPGTSFRSSSATTFSRLSETRERTGTTKSGASRPTGSRKGVFKSAASQQESKTTIRSKTESVRRGKNLHSSARKSFISTASGASSASLLRLNKFLADAGVCSRREADEIIRRGEVKVNGKLITEVGTKVHLADLVTVKGKPINAEKHLTYLVLNKPKDTITTMSDEKGRKTVMDLLPPNFEARVYPVGRLDRNTTGTLLLTNDGELAHRLTHPKYEIPRQYSVGLDKKLTLSHAHQIAGGVDILTDEGSYISAPCEILLDPEDHRHLLLEIREGKNREVRRIFESLGYEVKKLDRKSFATISVRGVRRGEYRHLTREEVRGLETLVGLERRYDHSSVSHSAARRPAKKDSRTKLTR